MSRWPEHVRVSIDSDSPQQRFGFRHVRDALIERGTEARAVGLEEAEAEVRVVVEHAPPPVPGSYERPDEAFEIAVDGDGRVCITCTGEAGAMYGLLDMAESVRMDRDIRAARVTPHLPFRALKFNLPWSSYRPGKVMTLHTETCRDQAFWGKLIDMLAENRFNVLSLWNLHPFPYMLQPTGYPEARMFSDREMEDWRALWRFIFRRAKERAIDTYVVFWNIFVSPPFAKAHGIDFGGREYLWGDGDTSDLVKDYNRQCIRQLIDEYEDLTGIGMALGDRMQNLTPREKQGWVEDVVLAEVKRASRPIGFIHRAPFTADPSIMRESLDRASLNCPTWVEYKFNWSHAHSTPRLSMTHDEGKRKQGVDVPIDDRYWNPAPHDYKLAWMARNEDFFILRWGEPDFIREHIRHNTRPDMGGYFVGSEGYIPAKDYTHRPSDHVTWQYAFEKQWLFYLLWGRLLFDPATEDAVFAAAFDQRYGDGVGRELLEAWKRASRMPLRLASFHGSTWDYTLYSEGFLAAFPALGRHDGDTPFISVDEFIECPTLDRDLVSIEEYVAATLDGSEADWGERLAPLTLADQSEADGAAVLAAVDGLRGREKVTPTLACELDDLEAWAHLSLYLAYKLRGATALHQYRRSGDPTRKEAAIASLERALEAWREVSRVTDAHYHEAPYIERSDYAVRFAWRNFVDDAARDVEIARKA